MASPVIWAAVFNDPGTGVQTRVPGLDVPADTLIVYVGARDLAGSTLGVGGPGGFSVIGSAAFIDTVEARGEQGALDSPATDFGPWGGAVSFDTTDQDTNPRAWHFDLNSDPTAGLNDFFSVALHELGHLLGIGQAESWQALIDVAMAEFTGPASVAEFGDNVPLADAAHWMEGIMSEIFRDGAAQEAAMDPTLTIGTRKLFTDLDVAGLDDIGWEIDPAAGGGVVIPEPASLALTGLGGLALLRRRR